MKAVVDADVWLAAASPSEPSHTDASAFLISARAKECEFYEPTVVLAEVAASSARRTRNAADGALAMERLQRTPAIHFTALSSARAVAAGQLASRCFLRGADSVYAALAAELGAELVTLDKELRQRAAGEVSALTPAEWMARHGSVQP